jgi:alpha-amylase
VYFAMTDRFYNGDPTNDGSYGRTKDGESEVGTWHGGDLRGLTAKLDHLSALGVNAVWITSPVEQVHGWVGGGSGDFKHYGYHGYWALDFTRLDANLGTPDDMRAFVRAAHQRGIRVVLDVVMNHPGYATGDDLLAYLPQVIDPAFRTFTKPAGGSWHDWNQLVDYDSMAWLDWWGSAWIRAGFPGHNRAGMTDLNMALAFLPDFITEDFRPTTRPPFFARKPDTAVVDLPNSTVRNYLVSWHAQWVREYGIDGFRCDTAKHVEFASWKALSDASSAALREWKAANPSEVLDDQDFWMTGEVFPHGVVKDEYFQNGFDSIINFDFQKTVSSVLDDHAALDAMYSMYASTINPDPAFNVLSYASSHDTSLYFGTTGGDLAKQAQLGTVMLMLPGGVQIYYGDETARPVGPNASDEKQGTRSDMNWDHDNAALLAHWQKLGTFRQKHAAVGAGAHAKLEASRGYAFARRRGPRGRRGPRRRFPPSRPGRGDGGVHSEIRSTPRSLRPPKRPPTPLRRAERGCWPRNSHPNKRRPGGAAPTIQPRRRASGPGSGASQLAKTTLGTGGNVRGSGSPKRCFHRPGSRR